MRRPIFSVRLADGRYVELRAKGGTSEGLYRIKGDTEPGMPGVRGCAPCPAVFPLGRVGVQQGTIKVVDSPVVFLNRRRQFEILDLMSRVKYGRHWWELSPDEYWFVSNAFSQVMEGGADQAGSGGLAFTNGSGSGTRRCYPTGENLELDKDIAYDKIRSCSYSVHQGTSLWNEAGVRVVRIRTFLLNEAVPEDLPLWDPRIIWAVNVGSNGKIFKFHHLGPEVSGVPLILYSETGTVDIPAHQAVAV